jgi:hypothetical protein
VPKGKKMKLISDKIKINRSAVSLPENYTSGLF